MRYAQIRKMDISNGEGIGVALFVQGCHFHCKGCFNQETWDYDGGKEWTDIEKNKFFDAIEKPYVARVSFLGGEPLSPENWNPVLSLIEEVRIRFPDKKIWLYTGYTFETIVKSIDTYWISNIDVIVDGQFDLSKRNYKLKWCGSSNQRIIDVQASLKTGRTVHYYKNEVQN